MQASLPKLSTAMGVSRRWAQRRGLVPSETGYLARTRGRRPLRFSVSGATDIERAYRTHWVSPALSAAKRNRLAQRQSRPPDLVVISPLKDWTCTTCPGTRDLLIMQDVGPVCLRCASLGHLFSWPPVTPDSPVVPTAPASCPQSWSASAAAATAVKGKGLLV